MQSKVCSMSAKIKVTLISIILITALAAGSLSVDAASIGGTTGTIKAKSGAILRQYASTKSAKVGSMRNKARVTILSEAFVSKNSTKNKKKWYYVTDGRTSGYVRSDLVKNISYGGAPVSTTAKVNYRKGAGNKMKKKGTFKKGKSLTAVLTATAKDGSTWYKVRKGSGFVYVSGKYIRDAGVSTAAAPAAQAAGSAVSASSPQLSADPSAPLSITTNNVRVPEDRATDIPFTIYGTIASNHIIESAEVGVADANGNWATRATASVNSTVFNIASVDSQVKFGTIPPGSYNYNVNVMVDGNWNTPVKKPFTVKQAQAPAMITQTAKNLAWPIGTPTDYFRYSGGSATGNFQAALNAVYPNRGSWSAAPRVGASCDVFVGTTIRYSGYDPNYPRGWDDQYSYLQSSDKWVRIAYNGNTSVLRSGDIVLYKRDSGGCHTCIYVVENGVPYLAEAQIKKYYGYMKSNISKIQDFSNKKFIVVYRATN